MIDRWRGVPLRLRLVLIIMALVAVALAVTAVATNVVLKNYLVGRVDDQLRQNSRVFDRPIGSESQRPRGAGGPDLPSPVYVQFNASDGSLLAPLRYDTRRLTSGDLPDLPSIDEDVAQQRSHHPFTVKSKDGDSSWRVLVRPHADGSSVAIAIDINDVHSTTGRLATIEIGLAALVLALLGGVSYYVVRSSLRPLVEVERTAESIAAGDLAARVPDVDPRTEVGGLSVALNAMLGQIEEAVRNREAAADAAEESEQRMRRFVADASHELRTPLTSIRGFAELYGQGAAADRETVDRFMDRIEQEAARMGVLVEDLLLLAKLDQERPLVFEPVDLRTIAEDAVHDAHVVQPDRPIVCTTAAASVLVSGDEARLRQVVGNLVRNALVHTPRRTPVSVTVEKVDDDGVVVVRDKGPGMSAGDAERIFERFYRVESSRARASGGTGLGLSIVSALVQGHGGTVDVQTVPGTGSTFTVRIPLAEPAAADQD